VFTLIVVGVVAALIVVAFLVFGLPRLRRARGATVPLFDDRDVRDLAALRRAAVAAAAAADWPLAIEERFRAIVRGLVDRDLVQVHPGTTARGFADAATPRFPEFAAELRAAAAGFEGVRYLGRAGDAADYERATALEVRLSQARSEADAPAAASPGVGR
jgi:hypothetical protein